MQDSGQCIGRANGIGLHKPALGKRWREGCGVGPEEGGGGRPHATRRPGRSPTANVIGHKNTVGAFSHSAGTVPIITLFIPGTPPETPPPPTEARMIHSKQHRGCRVQDPGTRGYRRWGTAGVSHSAGTAHGAPPLSCIPHEASHTHTTSAPPPRPLRGITYTPHHAPPPSRGATRADPMIPRRNSGYCTCAQAAVSTNHGKNDAPPPPLRQHVQTV